MVHLKGHRMELDVYIEDLRIAFEYQGEQHYKPIYWTDTNFQELQKRDEEKRRACKEVRLYGVLNIAAQYYVDRSTVLVGSKGGESRGHHSQMEVGSHPR